MESTVKIQEFYLSPESISAVCLGRLSAHVVATGGVDGVVNIFKLGKRSFPLLTFGKSSSLGADVSATKTSTVSCLAFDQPEEQLAVAHGSGVIELWDVASSKLAWCIGQETLSSSSSSSNSNSDNSSSNSSSSSVRCLDFHPYGNFFASGRGSEVKTWDQRTKTEAHRFVGHTSPIQRIRYSPDGRTLVSGDESGQMKLWDFVGGKLLHDFPVCEGSVFGIDFHPHECLLALCAGYQTMLFDMDSFDIVATTPKELNEVKRCVFSRDGQVYVSATDTSFKLWGWEPLRCFGKKEMQWNNLSDLCVSEMEEIVGVAHNTSITTVFSSNLKSFPPWAEPSSDTSLDFLEGLDFSRGSQLATQSFVQNTSSFSSPLIDAFSASPFASSSPMSDTEIADSQTLLARSLTSSSYLISSSVKTTAATLICSTPTLLSSTATNVSHSSSMDSVCDILAPLASTNTSLCAPATPASFAPPFKKPMSAAAMARDTTPYFVRTLPLPFHTSAPVTMHLPRLPPSEIVSVAQLTGPSPFESTAKESLPATENSSFDTLDAVKEISVQAPAGSLKAAHAESSKLVETSSTNTQITRSKVAAPSRYREEMQQAKANHKLRMARAAERFVPAATDEPNPFVSGNTLCRSPVHSSARSIVKTPEKRQRESELATEQNAVFQAVRDEHSAMVQLLNKRLDNLRALKTLWIQGQGPAALAALRVMDDMSTTVDFLNATERAIDKQLDLETATEILHLLKLLLSSRFESHITCALRYLRILVRHFQNPSTASESSLAQLKLLYPSVSSLTNITGKVAPLAQEVVGLLNSILDVTQFSLNQV